MRHVYRQLIHWLVVPEQKKINWFAADFSAVIFMAIVSDGWQGFGYCYHGILMEDSWAKYRMSTMKGTMVEWLWFKCIALLFWMPTRFPCPRRRRLRNGGGLINVIYGTIPEVAKLLFSMNMNLKLEKSCEYRNQWWQRWNGLNIQFKLTYQFNSVTM